MRAGKNWTKEEDELLAEMWGTVSIGTISQRLGRSKLAIENRRHRLHLGAFLENGDYISFKVLLDSLGRSCCGYKDISWIKNRDFPIHYKRVGKNRFRVVNVDEFWKWAEKNQDLLDFKDFEENILGEEPKWAKEKRHRDYENSLKYKTTPWTAAEDSKLKRLLNEYLYSYKEMSMILGRTCGAISRRCNDLGLKARPLKAGNRNFWTEEEVGKIEEMILNGYKYMNIAEELPERSEKALRGFNGRKYGTESLDKIREIIKNRRKEKC